MDLLECAARSIAKGQWPEAAALLEQACAREQRGSDAWAVCTSMLGECLTRLGRFEEAQPLLEGTHAVLEREQGSSAWRESVRRLVDHWQLRGFLERAADFHVLLVMDDRKRAATPTTTRTHSEEATPSGNQQGNPGSGKSWLDGWSEVSEQ
jgi:hypothetical protein